jgi:putative ABC transport system substrate-binding protein
MPTMYYVRDFADAGGLISYGPRSTRWRSIPAAMPAVLAGAKPADLPVLQPTRFELVLNLKTARAQGISIPATLQASADEVIE